jgi:hypothetical protein
VVASALAVDKEPDRRAQLDIHPLRRDPVRPGGRRCPCRPGPPPPAGGHRSRCAGHGGRAAGLERDPARHANQFFTDAPLRLLPASWQDIGSGVFALAAAAVLLGIGPLATAPARRTIGLAVLCGLAAFMVDIYLY